MDRWKTDFIACLRSGKEPAICASRCAGLPLAVVQGHRDSDPDFGAAWENVLPEGGDGESLTSLRVLTPGSLEPLLWAQCSDEEAAAYFGMTEEEMLAAIESDAPLKKVYDLARTGGKAALKVAQMDKALAGDSAMLTWAGKNHLGQSDKLQIEDKSKVGNAPVTVNQIFLRTLTTEQLDQLMGQGFAIDGVSERVPDIELVEGK